MIVAEEWMTTRVMLASKTTTATIGLSVSSFFAFFYVPIPEGEEKIVFVDRYELLVTMR